MNVDATPLLFFRTSRRDRGGGSAGERPGETPGEQSTEREKYIRCRHCLQEITKPSERIAVNGVHRHTFANPHGIVYEIGSFRTVLHCGFAGVPTLEFTWFPGYSWRVVYCGMCRVHLGWVFESSGGDRFFGLILKHLTEPEA